MPGLSHENWMVLALIAVVMVGSVAFAIFDNRRRRRAGEGPVGPRFVEIGVAATSTDAADQKAAKSDARPNQIEIARLIEIPAFDKAIGSMLVTGCLLMILVTIFGGRDAMIAWGVVWTGWNVLCGVTLLNGKRRDYVVYRAQPADERR